MGDQQPFVGALVHPAGHQGAEERTDRQHRCGRDVVAHGHGEAGRQRGPQLTQQRRPVPERRDGDGARTDGGHRPPAGEHPHDHEHGAEVEQGQPDGLVAPVIRLVGSVQESIGEVLAPHQDRVAHRAEEQQVDHQPPWSGQRCVQERGRDHRHHPHGCRQVTQRPEAAAAACGDPRARGPRGACSVAHVPLLRDADQVAVPTNASRATMLSTPPVCQAQPTPRPSPIHSRRASDRWSSAAGPMSAGW